MIQEYITLSADETEKLGEEFAVILQPGDVVCLYGDLGAGKTTFTKGIAKGLGIHSRILSPTFSLIRIHDIEKGPIKELDHLDLYRLDTLDDIQKIGIEEILDDSEGVTVIEWPEKLKGILPKQRYDIKIDIDDDKRNIKIHKYE